MKATAFFLLTTICLINPSYALESDNKLPVEVHANSADINQSQHLGTYEGAVEFDQGTTHLRAHKATTKADAQNKFTEAILHGNSEQQAHFWTTVNPEKPPLHAFADTIKYFPSSKTIQLIGNARIVQGENIFTAPQITYDINKQHVISSNSSTNQKRTVIIFHPQRKK